MSFSNSALLCPNRHKHDARRVFGLDLKNEIILPICTAFIGNTTVADSVGQK